MKYFYLLVLQLVCFLSPIESFSQQWQQTNGPYGGSVQCIATDGTNIFAGTKGYGIFRSTDYGSNWVAVNTGLSNLDVRAIAISGTSIFAGTWGDGMFKSTDNGASFAAINNGLDAGHFVTSIIINNLVVFIGTWSGQGIFMSTNGGFNWVSIQNELSPTVINTLVKQDSNIFVGIDGGYGIYKSTNTGVSWKQINTGLISGYLKSILSFLSIGSEIFAGTDSGAYLLHINDTVWQSKGLGDYSVHTLIKNGSNILAGTYGSGIFIIPPEIRTVG